MRQTTLAIEELDNIALVMQAKMGRDFCELFTSRGWNLYKASDPIEGLEELKETIKQGATGQAEFFQRYILLPAATSSNDPDVVFTLIRALLNKGRYPFFVDIVEERKDEGAKVRARGVYLIDSVMITGDQVLLQVDLNTMLALGMEIPNNIVKLENPCICFDSLEMYDKIKQVTNTFR